MCLRVLIHVTQTPKRRKSCIHANKTIDIREEILDLITSTSRSAREAELRTRIAKHLSGRVRPSWRSHVTEYANILWHHRYVSTESEKCPVERPMTGQNTHFEQLIR